MMNTKLIDFYSGLISDYQAEHNKLKRKGRMLALLRGILFIGMIASLFIFWNSGAWVVSAIAALVLFPFLAVVKYHVSMNNKIRLIKELIHINHSEIKGLNDDHSGFAPGDEFIDPDHPYSFDLDIFGNGSIFQMLNRSCTSGGSVLLAGYLKKYEGNINETIEKQAAIKELADLPHWRQNFQATGNIVLESHSENRDSTAFFQSNMQNLSSESSFHDEMMEWTGSSYYFNKQLILRYLLLALPVISLVLFILMLSGLIPVLGFILFGLLQLMITGFYLKKINQVHRQISRKTQILKKYGCLLKLIEKQDFNSGFLQKLKRVSGISDKTAGKSLNQLQSLAGALDNRLNILFSIVSNAYLLYDLQVVYRIEKWRKQNMVHLSSWFDVIYQFDALSGMAAFSFNHPNYCFPELKLGGFILDMEQAGHPLISDKQRINNNIEINGHSRLLVITGANMAGKSTFLRTIGVNLVLAMAGSVVCAQKFIFSPIALHTSIRTSDSVQKNESYFFAELKRLKSIIDRMQKGELMFVIIDEMLRGTNSKDKHLGSEALIEQLIRLKASGLLATHDIALGVLAEKYPENVKNYRFEVEIQDNELVFDYKLKDGISQNLNATFLMKKMGITV